MHPLVFKEFDQICSKNGAFDRVLEIGTTRQDQSLLTLPSLTKARLRVGVNQEEGFRGETYSVLKGNANNMAFFEDQVFDLVLCNSVLEHDPSFWLTLAEARRVACPGALLVFGVPGFSIMGSRPELRTIRWLARLPWIGNSWKTRLEALEASAFTLGIHNYPSDYYRFSEQAMREIILQGLVEVKTKIIMEPPRVVGWGFMPGT